MEKLSGTKGWRPEAIHSHRGAAFPESAGFNQMIDEGAKHYSLLTRTELKASDCSIPTLASPS